jgi:exodeoxyribonuclease VII small subunit
MTGSDAPSTPDRAPVRGVPATRDRTPGGGLAGQAEDVGGLLFDQALEELRGVVARLESGGLPLEESIALYERGAALHDHCARLLDTAEARVQRLVDGVGGAPRLMDLRPDDDDEG